MKYIKIISICFFMSVFGEELTFKKDGQIFEKVDVKITRKSASYVNIEYEDVSYHLKWDDIHKDYKKSFLPQEYAKRKAAFIEEKKLFERHCLTISNINIVQLAKPNADNVIDTDFYDATINYKQAKYKKNIIAIDGFVQLDYLPTFWFRFNPKEKSFIKTKKSYIRNPAMKSVLDVHRKKRDEIRSNLKNSYQKWNYKVTYDDGTYKQITIEMNKKMKRIRED